MMHFILKLKSCIFCFVIFSSVLYAQQSQIAIQLPIADSKVGSYFKHQLRGRLEEAATKTGFYKVVDRARTDQILKELQIQRSGFVKEKEIKVWGETLGVDYILTSELQMSDSQKSISITCSLINIETAEIVKSAHISAENDETVFETACYSLISKLQLDQINQSMPTITKVADSARKITNSIGMGLVLIPAGEFLMGNPRPNILGADDEKPARRVSISKAYYLGTHLVTQAEWQAVMGNNPSLQKGNEYPVTNVSWEEAKEFCRTLTKIEGRVCRLPTEAEWEYACKAGSQGGTNDSINDYAWHSDNSQGYLKKVGLKEPNKWGLYDMLGNAGEWCQDWFDTYSAKSLTDPAGPPGGKYRVVRGGSFGHREDKCNPTSRHSHSPSESNNFTGFRIVSETNGP
jgi:formylglycine-generating enzyme required for sulfatase activity